MDDGLLGIYYYRDSEGSRLYTERNLIYNRAKILLNPYSNRNYLSNSHLDETVYLYIQMLLGHFSDRTERWQILFQNQL